MPAFGLRRGRVSEAVTNSARSSWPIAGLKHALKTTLWAACLATCATGLDLPGWRVIEA